MPKALPNLCLAPHEMGDLASTEPACAPATHQVRLWNMWGGGKYLIRQVTNLSGGAEYVARRQGVSRSPLLRFPWSTNQDLSDVVADLRQGKFCRIVFFDERGRLVTSSREWHRLLHINSFGRAYWGAHDGVGAEFSWSDSRSKRILLLPTQAKITDAKIARYLQQMLAGQDSDCAFAWRWVGLSEQEQSELVFRVLQGNREQCLFLLRSIIWSDRGLDQSKTWTWNIGLTTESKLAQGHWSSRDTELECDDKSDPLNSRQARSLELIVHHFGLHIDSTASEHRVVRYWFDYGDGDIFRVPAAPCSEHERLEAHLQLRDWLHDKVTSEELDSLIPTTG